LVGATYLKFDQKQDIDVSTVIPFGFVMPGQPLDVPIPLQFLLGGNVHATSTAAYADLRYKLSPKLALLGGLRLNHDSKSADEYLEVQTFAIDIPYAKPADASWTSHPGSIGVEYQVDRDMLTYAKVAHGFKSGA